MGNLILEKIEIFYKMVTMRAFFRQSPPSTLPMLRHPGEVQMSARFEYRSTVMPCLVASMPPVAFLIDGSYSLGGTLSGQGEAGGKPKRAITGRCAYLQRRPATTKRLHSFSTNCRGTLGETAHFGAKISIHQPSRLSFAVQNGRARLTALSDQAGSRRHRTTGRFLHS